MDDQPPTVERLAQLKRLHQEWTAKLYAIEGADPDLAAAFTQGLADLEALIGEVEIRGGHSLLLSAR